MNKTVKVLKKVIGNEFTGLLESIRNKVEDVVDNQGLSLKFRVINNDDNLHIKGEYSAMTHNDNEIFTYFVEVYNYEFSIKETNTAPKTTKLKILKLQVRNIIEESIESFKTS